MRRFYLTLCALAFVVCCGSPESSVDEPEPQRAPLATTNSENTESDYDACVRTCRESDNPGCERTCSSTPTMCAAAPPGLPSARRERGLPPRAGLGGTGGDGGAAAGGASSDPQNGDDCLCVGEYPPSCASVCAPPEKDTKEPGGLKCSFVPPR